MSTDSTPEQPAAHDSDEPAHTRVSASVDTAPAEPAAEAVDRHRRRSLRRLVVVGLLFAALLTAGLTGWRWILAGAGLVTPWIENQVAESIGDRAVADIDDAAFVDDGRRLLIRGLNLRLQTLRGEGGHVLRVPVVEVTFAQTGPWWRDREIVSIRVSRPRLRVSEAFDDGSLNLAALFGDEDDEPTPGHEGFQWPSLPPLSPSEINALPAISVEGGSLEFGAHDAASGRWTLRRALAFSGGLTRVPPGDAATIGTALFWLAESESARAPAGRPAAAGERSRLRLEGRLTSGSDRIHATVRGLALTEEQFDLLPHGAREWASALSPSGTIGDLALRVGADGQLAIATYSEDVAFLIPLATLSGPSSVSSPDAEQHLKVTRLRGRLEIDATGVRMRDVEANLDDVGYAVSGHLAFAGTAVRSSLHLGVTDFELSRNLNLLRLLPDAVRLEVERELSQLAGTAGTVQAEVTLTAPLTASDLMALLARGGAADSADPLTLSDPAPDSPPSSLRSLLRGMQFRGEVEIVGGEGMHRAFPYPLKNVTGRLEFDRREVRIAELRATGPGGAPLYMSGTVTNPGPNPSFDLKVRAPRLPIDDSLRHAIGPTGQEAVDVLFHQRAWEGLLHEGIVREAAPGEMESLAPLRERGGSDRLAGHQGPLPFRLGGDVELEARVVGQPGPDSTEQTTIYLRPAVGGRPLGVLFERFPHPGWLVDGEVRITDDDVVLTRDIVLRAINGGDVRLSGHAVRGQTIDGGELDVYFNLTASDVPVDHVLMRAIPGRGIDELPAESRAFPLSAGGQWVAALAPEGEVDLVGELMPGPTGRTELNLVVTMRNAALGVRPPPIPEADMQGHTFRWPLDYPLHDVNGRATITRDKLILHRVAGEFGSEFIAVSGVVDWTDDDNTVIDLTFDGDDMQLASHHVALASGLIEGAERSDLETLRTRHGLGGTFDMRARLTRHVPDTPTYRLDLWPTFIQLAHADPALQTSLSDVSGQLTVIEDLVTFGGLTGRPDAGPPETPAAERRGETASRATLSGAWSWIRDEAIDLTLALENLDAGSPFVRRLVALRAEHASGVTPGESDFNSNTTAGTAETDRGPLDRLLRSLDVRGRFGGRVHLVGKEAVGDHALLSHAGEGMEKMGDDSGEGALSIRADLLPSSLTFRLPGRNDIHIQSLRGRIEADDTDVRVHEVVGQVDGQYFGLDGKILSDGRFDADLALTVEIGPGVDAWRPLLPGRLADRIDDFGIDPGFDSSLRRMKVRLVSDLAPDLVPARLGLLIFGPPPPTETTQGQGDSTDTRGGANGQATVASIKDHGFSLDIEGDLLLLEARADRLPMPLQRLRGVLSFQIVANGPDPTLEARATLRAAEVRLGDRILHDVEMTMLNADGTRQLIIPDFRATLGGGIIEGRARVDLPAPDLTAASPASATSGRYELWLTAADIDADTALRPAEDVPSGFGAAGPSVDSLLSASARRRDDDNRITREGLRTVPSFPAVDDPAIIGGQGLPGAQRQVRAGEAGMGRLRASFSMVGEFSDPGTRRGRGLLRIEGGSVYSVPLAIWVLQLSALALPTATAFDEAQVQFFLDGTDVAFESIELSSTSIRLTGEGRLDTRDRALDLRLQTQSRMPTPILTPIWQTVRDTMFSLEVTGTLDSPKVRLRPNTPGRRSEP